MAKKIIENIVPDTLKEKLGERLIDATFEDLIAALAFSRSFDFVPSKEEILDSQQFADYMGTSKRTLDRIIEHNELKQIRFRCGSKWKWNVRAAWNPEVLEKINQYN